MISAPDADGRQLRHVVRRDNTACDVWADSACRSQGNEKWLANNMVVSRIHRRKPKGKSMPLASARANAGKSSVGAAVEHVLAHRKNRFGLFVRTIGPARAEAGLTLASPACNFDRPVLHQRRKAMGKTSAWLVGSGRTMDPVCFWQVFSGRYDGSVFARGGGSDRRG